MLLTAQGSNLKEIKKKKKKKEEFFSLNPEQQKFKELFHKILFSFGLINLSNKTATVAFVGTTFVHKVRVWRQGL